MARYRRRSRGNRNYSDSQGYERARKHIEEAEQLSKELGGTDHDVKEYFFSLSGDSLKSVLDAYERKYGRIKREYAENTLPRWRSGRRHMSGLVAGRLFSLLPPRMPLRDKYGLVDTLWKKHCPHTDKVIRIGEDADAKTIIQEIYAFLLDRISHYKIPEPLERRFQWLAAGDVDIYQKLLNHFMDMEKALIVQGMKERLPVLLKHSYENREVLQKLSHSIQIGNHKLELVFDPNTTGISFEDPSQFRTTAVTSSDTGCLWFIIIGIGLFVLYILFSSN